MTGRSFFVSHRSDDWQWAEWIARQLVHGGFTVHLDRWDVAPGASTDALMHQALASSRATIAVVTATYFQDTYTEPEWLATFHRDPIGGRRPLIPVVVEPDVQVPDLIGGLRRIDLAGLPEAAARQRLLAGVQSFRDDGWPHPDNAAARPRRKRFPHTQRPDDPVTLLHLADLNVGGGREAFPSPASLESCLDELELAPDVIVISGASPPTPPPTAQHESGHLPPATKPPS